MGGSLLSALVPPPSALEPFPCVTAPCSVQQLISLSRANIHHLARQSDEMLNPTSPPISPTSLSSPAGSFTPRPEFLEARAEAAASKGSESAVGRVSLSGSGGLKINGVQKELVDALDNLLRQTPRTSPNDVSSSTLPRAADQLSSSSSPASPSTQAKPFLTRALSSNSFILVSSPLSTKTPSLDASSGSVAEGRQAASSSTSALASAMGERPIWRPGVSIGRRLTEERKGLPQGTSKSCSLKKERRTELIGMNWTLNGGPWKVRTSEELESARLCVALVQTICRFGWSIGASVQAGKSKSDHHSFLLSSSLPLQSSPADPAPPLFAISFPKPDVISIIDPPPAMTPTILQAVRSAVGEGAEEGWVCGNRSSGVYTFRIAKVGGWWKGGSKAKYRSFVPPILTELLRLFSTAFIHLVTTFQLRPTSHHRDLWILRLPSPSPSPQSASPSKEKGREESTMSALWRKMSSRKPPPAMLEPIPSFSESASPSHPAEITRPAAPYQPVEMVPLPSDDQPTRSPPAFASQTRFVEGRSSVVESAFLSSKSDSLRSA